MGMAVDLNKKRKNIETAKLVTAILIAKSFGYLLLSMFQYFSVD